MLLIHELKPLLKRVSKETIVLTLATFWVTHLVTQQVVIGRYERQNSFWRARKKVEVG